MLRRIGAVIAGLLVVGAVVALLQGVAGGPVWAMAFFSELLGAFLGSLTAGHLGRDHRTPLAAIVVGFAARGSVLNWGSFPHPTWFITGQCIGYPLVLLTAFLMLHRREEHGPAAVLPGLSQ